MDSSDSAELNLSLDIADSKQSEEQSFDDVIKVNIGGTKFITTRSTLLKSGYFRALLSGNFADPPKVDGYLFIDRDPILFGYLLQYLRSDFVSIPTKLLQELYLEAKYLQIDLNLMEYIKMCQPETVTIMKEYQCYLRINEVRICKRFANPQRQAEMDEIWNHFGVFDEESRAQLRCPMALTAYLSRRGYEVVSSSMSVVKNADANYLITLKKVIPETIVITNTEMNKSGFNE